jgi:hypothetical protein
MEEIGHEVSEYPMKEFLPEIEHFIRNFVLDKNVAAGDKPEG